MPKRRHSASRLVGEPGNLRRASVSVSTAAPAGSDAWLDAQVALSRLQAARLVTSDALQTLDDQLMARGIIAPGPVLEEAHARALALVKAQLDRYAAMAALLPAN
jgi:hypothetical protein